MSTIETLENEIKRLKKINPVMDDAEDNKGKNLRFQKEVNEINKELGQTERIKRFRLVSEEWSSQTGELSPTLKLKRKFLYEKYALLIEEIFSVEAGTTLDD